MPGFITNIEIETEENKNFRKVLSTGKHSQLVVMYLLPSEDIGEEIHEVDQFIKIEKGTGKAVLDQNRFDIEDGWAVMIPAGTKHNILNTSTMEPMKLCTVYSPPEHREGTIHKTKEEAIKSEK